MAPLAKPSKKSDEFFGAVNTGDVEKVRTTLLSPDSLDPGDIAMAVALAAKYGQDAMMELLLAESKGNKELDILDLKKYSSHAAGRTALSYAAGEGRCGIAKMLLEYETDAGRVFDVNTQDTLFGQTPLSWAAEAGHNEVVELLLAQSGANVDMPDLNGQTPLAWAAEKGHVDVVRILLASGHVDPDRTDKGGRTPLWHGAERGHVEVVRVLLEHKPSVSVDARDSGNRPPLWWAARNGHTKVICLLLDHGADIEADVPHVGYTGDWDEFGTALYIAAEELKIDVVTLLIERGANPNAGKKGKSVLLRLIHHREKAKAQIPALLARGANPDCRDEYSQTPMHQIARDGDMRAARWFIDAGADLEAVTDAGFTPLRYAVNKSRLEMVKLLLDLNVSVEVEDQYGNRPLHAAALEAAGASKRNTEPMEVLKLLLTTGRSDTRVANHFGRTPLHSAAEAGLGPGLEPTVRLLLEHGADPKARDENLVSPLDMVKEFKAAEIQALEELLGAMAISSTT